MHQTYSPIIEEIIAREWAMFQEVNNIGGRASCQDQPETFRRMRAAQYLNWPEELLASIRTDLIRAEEAGWNMITEKYARMIEHTHPAEYAALADALPVRSAERLAAQESVIAREVAWDEDFCARHPKYASRGRHVHSADDNAYETSSETYLRGEMSTWSDETFRLYRDWNDSLAAEGRNLSEMTAEKLVRQYGYASIDEAEAGM